MRIPTILSSLVVLIGMGASAAHAIDINPESQVGPTVKRWGWDLKGNAGLTNTTTEAEALYDDVPANLVRVPIFVDAHFSNGTVDSSRYSTVIDSIQQLKIQNPDVDVFVSVKLRGGDSFLGPTSEPNWVTQGTAQWPADTGTIFNNPAPRPNPEFYSQLLADYFDYFDNQGISIDYVGINNETDGALGVSRYIDTVDRLNAELTTRGYNTADLQYIGPDAFSPNTTTSILNTLDSNGRLDTVDIVGSHQYPQFSNHTSNLWQGFSSITGGKEMWHTEVHMNASNSNNGGTATQNIERMRDGMGIVFSANMNGVDSFVWWGGGTSTTSIASTLKREIITSMVEAHPVQSPAFNEIDSDPDAPIYQAYRKGDRVTLWVAHPEFADVTNFPVDLLAGHIATEGTLGVTAEYWQGAGTFGNDVTPTTAGNLATTVNGNSQGFTIGTLPQNSIAQLSFVLTGNLVWHTGTDNFDNGFARSDGNLSEGASGADPFIHSGTENLYIGFGGNATLDSTTDMSSGSSVESIHVGTNQAAQFIDDGNGFGILSVNDAVSLTVGNGSSQVGKVGDFVVGDGEQGLLNWNSTGTLNVEGKLRVGQGAAGFATQTAGTIVAGATGGSGKFVAIGNGSGSDGSSYNLNNGTLVLGGGLTGGQFRELRVGSSATATFTLGDNSGAPGSAAIETRHVIYVGHNGGNGSMTINDDGLITQVTNGAALAIGTGGSQGTVTQNGGTYNGEHQVTIGGGPGSTGLYSINDGFLKSGTNGSGELRIGHNGGSGTLRIEGTATVNAGAELVIADTDSAGTTGLLQIVGSNASLSAGKLDNALATNETISWKADTTGLTPFVIRGDIGSSLFVELQHPSEIAATTGGMGDGIALDLDLSALAASNMLLTLIDNESTEAIQGLFENPLVANDLYEEGEFINDTGFDGMVQISYTGGTGNDVVLSLTIGNADFDENTRVEGADFLIWQRGFGQAGGLAQGDADSSSFVDQSDLTIWRDQYGTGTLAVASSVTVPEPSSYLLLFSLGLMRFRKHRIKL